MACADSRVLALLCIGLHTLKSCSVLSVLCLRGTTLDSYANIVYPHMGRGINCPSARQLGAYRTEPTLDLTI